MPKLQFLIQLMMNIKLIYKILKKLVHYLKIYFMGNLLYVIAVILVIGWAIGFVGYGTGGLIHVLLVIAIIVVLLRIIQGKRPL